MADVTAIQEAAGAMELAQLSLVQARTAELHFHKALAKAKSRALVWRPIAGPDPTWQMTAAAIIGLYENALHEAGCEGCAVKGGQISPTDHVAYREKHGSYLAGKMFSLTPRQHLIVNQIADAIIALGGQSDLLATVCSWGDTLPEDEVLDQLTTWNARRAAVVGNGQGVGSAVKGSAVEPIMRGIPLYDTLGHGYHPNEFTLDKTRHRLRFADETEFSARVIIEPKAGRELTSAEWKAIAEDPDLGDQYHG